MPKSAVLNPVVLAFIAGAVMSWGMYVPTVHRAAEQLHSSLRAFLCVGVAYFLTAVLIPVAVIFLFNDPTTRARRRISTRDRSCGALPPGLPVQPERCALFSR
jgi:hypothetical protein